jgi:hypothetical protein
VTLVRTLTTLSLLLLATGLMLAWPLVSAAIHYRAVRGQVMDVIPLPADGGLVRLAIAYEYPVPGGVRERALGYTQADDRLQAIADPLVAPALAEQLQRILPGRPVRIYLDVNHPLDTAFMLSPVDAQRPLSPDHGAMLVLLGLGCGILGQLARRRR